jgi:hypothetical protein
MATFQFSNTADSTMISALDAITLGDALDKLALDAGYPTWSLAVDAGAFDPSEMAVKKGETVWLFKDGRWVVSDTL